MCINSQILDYSKTNLKESWFRGSAELLENLVFVLFIYFIIYLSILQHTS